MLSDYSFRSMIHVKRLVFIALFSFSFHSVWGQVPIETTKKPKVVIPPPENKGPSLLAPKEKKAFLSEDFFNPTIEFKDPKSDLNNPPINMGASEQFLDAGKQYLNRLNRGREKEKNPNQFKTDQYLGIMLNDKEVVSRVLLTENFKGISIDLVMGFNKIDFVALNQGTSGPNTAEVRVFDDEGKLVGANRWNLATGVKATYIIVKEK